MADHQHLITIAPDGGWGWVIVIVSFYGLVFIDVPAFGYQAIEDDLMDSLQLSATDISVIFSTYCMSMFLVGPIAGGVCNRFGFRLTNLLGSILVISGLGASFFATEYLQFIALYGLVAGCGSSFILLVGNVATGFWFDHKRSIAFGLVSSANGVSVFTVYVSDYLANNYGFKYCFAAWAGLGVISFAASFLFSPPPMVELDVIEPTKEVDLAKITTMRPLEYDKRRDQRMSLAKLEKMSKVTGIPVGRISRPSIVPLPKPVGLARWCRCCSCCDCCLQGSVGSRPLYRKDIFYHGSVHYAANKEKQDRNTLALTMTKLPTTKDVQQEVECRCIIPEAITRAVHEMIDWKLLRSPYFLLILLSSIFVFTCRYIPFLVIKKYNRPYMASESASQLVLMMGFGAFSARMSIGFIMYKFQKISALSATIFVTVVGGTALCGLTLYHAFPYQMTLCFVAAAMTSLVTTLRSMIIIDLLGLSKLTSCTGILFFAQAFASFTGMPIAEMLRSYTGSYGASLIFSGAGFLMAGFSNIVLAIVSLRREKK